jgi:hypothetical protein
MVCPDTDAKAVVVESCSDMFKGGEERVFAALGVLGERENRQGDR